MPCKVHPHRLAHFAIIIIILCNLSGIQFSSSFAFSPSDSAIRNHLNANGLRNDGITRLEKQMLLRMFTARSGQRNTRGMYSVSPKSSAKQFSCGERRRSSLRATVDADTDAVSDSFALSSSSPTSFFQGLIDIFRQDLAIIDNDIIEIETTLADDASSAIMEIERDGAEALNVLEEAILPTNTDQLLVIAFSDLLAGFVSGFASRLVAFLLGDRKRDPTLAKGTVTGTYFGIRSVVRNLAVLSGLPRPIVLIVGVLGASLLSESAKVASRTNFKPNAQFEEGGTSYSPLQTEDSYNSTQTLLDLISRSSQVSPPSPSGSIADLPPPQVVIRKKPRSNGADRVLTLPELTQDVSKWVVYDLLADSATAGMGSGAHVSFEQALLFGLASGLASHGLFELLTLNRRVVGDNGNEYTLTSTAAEIATRFFKAGLEGATLFGAYEGTNAMMILPSSFVPPDIAKILNANFGDSWNRLLRYASTRDESVLNF